jgi:mRNA degradation ribonuclease J1/J2
MDEFREKVKSVSLEIFDEINALLKKHDLDNAEISRIEIKQINVKTSCCPPGKQRVCIKTADGKVYCKCV